MDSEAPKTADMALAAKTAKKIGFKAPLALIMNNRSFSHISGKWAGPFRFTPLPISAKLLLQQIKKEEPI